MEAEVDDKGKPDGLHKDASILTLFAHAKAAHHILKFLRNTEVGRRVDEKQRELEREARSELWSWIEKSGGSEEREEGGGQSARMGEAAGERERGGEG